jgi:hypothetical protein
LEEEMTISRSLFLRLLFVQALITISGSASTVLYQGTFPNDANVFLQGFTVNTTAQVTIQSYGYAGGTVPTSPLPTVIAAGGFAPNLILFDGTGAEIVSDNGGHCGATNADPATGNCDDPFIQQTLAAGNYTLALLVWDNVPADGLLADGFRQDGNPGFTCAEFGASGNFCDVTSALGVVRTGDYAVALTGAGLVSQGAAVPEPATLPLALIGCLMGFLARRRHQQSKHR